MCAPSSQCVFPYACHPPDVYPPTHPSSRRIPYSRYGIPPSCPCGSNKEYGDFESSFI
ncbi:hypothetical protein FIBSPDRAFT_849369 [Athelia psychrophila]|uniref:Uncharacterized protein n=1 Tax=Athelia psychrophila TaxID=1759441 RepID=A0A166UND4_9AGAM|nr:hypothetical protein FIBSPDRAFT_849369 [Fibularhizoctonia sp. CBS 109695]